MLSNEVSLECNPFHTCWKSEMLFFSQFQPWTISKVAVHQIVKKLLKKLQNFTNFHFFFDFAQNSREELILKNCRFSFKIDTSSIDFALVSTFFPKRFDFRKGRWWGGPPHRFALKWAFFVKKSVAKSNEIFEVSNFIMWQRLAENRLKLIYSQFAISNRHQNSF